jgi:hypothetical protein
MKLKPTTILFASVGLALSGLWLAELGHAQGEQSAKGDQKPTVFQGKDFKVVDFHPVRVVQADEQHKYLGLVIRGTPRFTATIPSQGASLVGDYASLQIDDVQGLLHQGRVGTNVLVTMTQPAAEGGERVMKVTATTTDYLNQGTKEQPAFKLDMKGPVLLTSTYELKKEVATLKGKAGHFEFQSAPSGGNITFKKGVIEGPVKLRFEGHLQKGDSAKLTVVSGSADRLEVTREGTDYLVKLIGNVVFEDNSGLRFVGDLGESATFRFSEDFGFKSYDGGNGVMSVPPEVLEQAGKGAGKTP